MIEFTELVQALNEAVFRASSALTDTHSEFFSTFFEDGKDGEDLVQILRETLLDQGALTEEQVDELIDRLPVSRTDDGPSSTALQPRRVAIDFPKMTPRGPAYHTVHVPLIAIAPIATTQIERVTLKADLLIQAQTRGEDACLLVSFDSPRGGTPAADSSVDDPREQANGRCSLEIVIKQGSTTDGRKKIIEGYERALRAQIPG